MFASSTAKLTRPGVAILLTFAFATAVMAGGFQISVGAPDASGDPQMKGAVLAVRTFGCHTPSDAKLTATAEGIVNGRRQSVPVEVTHTAKGVYAIKQQWPSAGSWVVAITGEYLGHTSSALVELGPNGKVQVEAGKGLPVRVVQRKLKGEEIDAALNRLTGNVAQSSEESDVSAMSVLKANNWMFGGAGALLFLFGLVGFKQRNLRSHI